MAAAIYSLSWCMCAITARSKYEGAGMMGCRSRRCGCLAGVAGLLVGLTSCGPTTTVQRDPSEKAEVQTGRDHGARRGDALAAASLCAASEPVFFSCAIGTKRVAVCGTASGARYRYGSPGRIELEIAEVTGAVRGFSGGGETQITAANKGYRYTVFDRTVRTSLGDDGRHDPVFSSGLVVGRGGRTVSARSCDDDAIVTSDASGVIAAGGFVEH